MSGNDWRRRLEAISDPNQRFMMAELYQMVMEISRQVDACAKSQIAFAQTMQNFVNLNEVVGSQIKELNRIVKGNDRDAEFHSVPIGEEPDDG